MKTDTNFLIISRLFLIRMRTVSHKSCRGTQDISSSITLQYFFLTHNVYEIMWTKYGRAGQVTCGNII